MRKIHIPEKKARSADVVVIGGGIVGVATAFYLSRAGLDTILVEMKDGLSTLTTAASIESFRAQFTEPAMAQLAKESIKVWENFTDVVGLDGYDINLHHGGYLFFTGDEGKVGDIKSAVEGYHAQGVSDSEFLTGDRIRRLYPWVSPRVKAGAFRAKDGWFSAHEATQGFARGCQARFFVHTRAVDIETDKQGVSAVVTDRGRISTRRIVNAAGPFASEVARMVGIDLPVFQLRLQRVFVQPNPAIPQDAPLTIDIDNDSYWRPETGGALIGWHDPEETMGEAKENPSSDWDFPAKALAAAMELSPFWSELAESFKKSDLSVQAGQSVFSPDDQPIISAVDDLPGFFLNCAYWPGVMLSAAAGQWTAKLVTGEWKPHDSPLRITRFKEGTATAPGALLRGRH